MSAPVLKVKCNYPDSKIPTKAYPTDSGFDVYIHSFKKLIRKDESFEISPSGRKIKLDREINVNTNESGSIMLNPMERVLIDTGISATVGPDYELQVRPRSGLAIKNGLTVLNTPGTVDESFRDSIGVIVINLSNTTQTLTRGMKIAQIVPIPVLLCNIEVVDDLSETERGKNGYGSTGI